MSQTSIQTTSSIEHSYSRGIRTSELTYRAAGMLKGQLAPVVGWVSWQQSSVGGKWTSPGFLARTPKGECERFEKKLDAADWLARKAAE